jgi:hypothetical protein
MELDHHQKCTSQAFKLKMNLSFASIKEISQKEFDKVIAAQLN